MTKIRTTYDDSISEDEATITLNWKGRLRVLLTGKVKLKSSLLRFILASLEAAKAEYDDDED